MSIKTIRFNREEEGMLKMVLTHYSTDFSTCVKELIAEKLEDLKDMKYIKRLKEGKLSTYMNADQISRLFEKNSA
jgi:predicted DNA-binding protein